MTPLPVSGIYRLITERLEPLKGSHRIHDNRVALGGLPAQELSQTLHRAWPGSWNVVKLSDRLRMVGGQ